MIEEMKDIYGLDAPGVFSAMLQVPRHKFVDKIYSDSAYCDGAIPIEHGQTMSQPYTVAFMTDLLDLKGDERVLEVGTGSGYQAAVLSHLAKEVYSVEIIGDLAKKAKKLLKKLGYKNVYVKQGSGEYGWGENAPFDAIIITAAVEGEIPDELLDQLKTGGKIVAPMGGRRVQTMTKFTKRKDGSLKQKKYQEYIFVPFIRE
jgi:protein-L-isoaspartate(D-aspartate) O-methyltransferase